MSVSRSYCETQEIRSPLQWGVVNFSKIIESKAILPSSSASGPQSINFIHGFTVSRTRVFALKSGLKEFRFTVFD